MIRETLRTIGHAARTGGTLLLEILDEPTAEYARELEIENEDLAEALDEMRRERDAAVIEAEKQRHSLDAYRADMSETDRKLRAAYTEIEEMAPAAVAYEKMRFGNKYYRHEHKLNEELPLVPWIEAESWASTGSWMRY